MITFLVLMNGFCPCGKIIMIIDGDWRLPSCVLFCAAFVAFIY